MDDDTRYDAMRARDRRFDGVFFVAVETTGIYCRPICPARTPRRDRCKFFGLAAEAERAGFRACFRCRPELAPGLARVDAVPRLARQAAARIEAGALDGSSVDALAATLGVTARHLRRSMEQELGVSPIAYAQTHRLAIARQLVAGTTLPLAEVAYSAGFASLRRFNALFRQRFGRPPSEVRRDGGPADGVTLRLDYRPPLDWPAMLEFLGARALPGIETVENGEYRRVLGEGSISVTADPRRPTLRARLSVSLAPRIIEIARRLRALFDLDARPDLIAEHLGRDPRLARSVSARPGLRVPGAFDPFEVAVRAVLGQQVSVKGATTLAGRLVARFGPPAAATLARAPLADVQQLGMPTARARTLIAVAQAVSDGTVDLEGEPTRTMAALEALPGIGPWTASYLAMRALGWPDAFPAGDLGVRKALGGLSERAVEERARAWSPWRAYAVMHLWHDAP